MNEDLIRILQEDIEGLNQLIKMYEADGKLNKAEDCRKELEEIKAMLAEKEDKSCSEKEEYQQ